LINRHNNFVLPELLVKVDNHRIFVVGERDLGILFPC